ncbi:hypothetical protein Hs30E_20550 [Lactococcus hodotermopsidis]|uniref:Uncharacterized protein n=1 Tax=Pseudolactococcus hodotermopsidis TaxID=2709157 RepID=A0A6A0BGL9_9LACT|nr:hypothetical protein [Lactococcus hodotermopsidis]GFH43508.1 hypothetical protein Hs30E_20550 [Lactococcus hodotermopsidis]
MMILLFLIMFWAIAGFLIFNVEPSSISRFWHENVLTPFQKINTNVTKQAELNRIKVEQERQQAEAYQAYLALIRESFKYKNDGN